MSEGNFVSDQERITAVLDHLRISKNRLGISIGYRNGMRFQNVLSGRSRITAKLAADIVDVYPEFSYEWLLEGTGEMLHGSGEVAAPVDYRDKYIAILERGNKYLEQRCARLERRISELSEQVRFNGGQIVAERREAAANYENIISILRGLQEAVDGLRQV
jgi:hypothetical protein